MVTYNVGGTATPVRYALVATDGTFTMAASTLRQVRAQLTSDCPGAMGLEYLAGCHPVAVYYCLPYGQDTRRMNKVANGIYWELSKPTAPEDIDPERDDLMDALLDRGPDDPSDRVVKLRGSVAFVCPHRDLPPEQETALREAHARVVARLRARGWL